MPRSSRHRGGAGALVVCVALTLTACAAKEAADQTVAETTTTTQAEAQPSTSTTTTTTVAAATTTTTTMAPTTTVAAMAFPAAFTGTGTLTLRHSFATGECPQPGQTIEVTLREDGAATAFLTQAYPGFGGFLLHPDGTYSMSGCGEPGQEFDLALTGTHDPPTGTAKGTVRLDRSDGVRILEGTYDAGGMTLEFRVEVVYEQFVERECPADIPNCAVDDPRIFWDYDFPALTPTSAP